MFYATTTCAWPTGRYSKVDFRSFDMLPQTQERYIKQNTRAAVRVWRFTHQIKQIDKGKSLRIELLTEADIHWSDDHWATVNTTRTKKISTELKAACLQLLSGTSCV